MAIVSPISRAHMRLANNQRASSEEDAMRQHSVQQKNRLHRTFIGALDLLDTLGREPDRWEEECLSYALGAMACDLYLVAEVELETFARPIAERPEAEMAALNAKPQRFTKAMLRHGLQFVLNRDKRSQGSDREMPAMLAAQRLGVSSFG